MMNWQLNPRRILIRLTGIALAIAILSITTEYVVEVLLAPERNSIRVHLLDLFSVNLEESIPTWYSVVQLFVAAILFGMIALVKYRAQDDYRHFWAGLMVLFIYLSMDEGALIHEIVADPLHRTFNTEGFLAFGWQIAAVPILIVLGLIYLRFFWHLSSRTRNLLFASAAIYAGGALVIEGFSAAIYDVQGTTMTYLAVATLEEFAEIIGVSLLIYTLTDYMVAHGYQYTLTAGDVLSSVERKPVASGSFIPVLAGLVLVTLTGIFALAWQVGDVPVETVEVTLPFYYPAQAELDAADTLILDVPDVFGIESELSGQVAADLLVYYPQVTVVALPGEGRSVLFAAEALPVDSTALTDLLHQSGFTQFVIFETDVVRLFTSTNN